MGTAIQDFEVLSFDCYGTLIDWESGIWAALQPLLAGSSHDRRGVLGVFSELESRHQSLDPGAPYPEILERVHHDLADRLGLARNPGMDARFGASVPDWPPFPDSPQALARLGEDHRLVILSNVDRRGIAASIEVLGASFDAVYTAEDVGSYKPDLRNFDYLIEHVRSDLGHEPADLLHVAQSLFHDHVPAKARGLTTAWIDRQNLSRGGTWGATREVRDPPRPDLTFFTLAELAEAAGAAG